MVDPNEFNNAKNALLRYYSSLQTSHGALMIGFTVALFTLIQFAQNVYLQISSIFPISIPRELALSIVMFVSILILTGLIIHAIFRIAFYGRFTIELMWIEVGEVSREPVHGQIHKILCDKVANSDKLLRLLPARYFIHKEKDSEIWKGYVSCLVLAIVPTLIILFLLS